MIPSSLPRLSRFLSPGLTVRLIAAAAVLLTIQLSVALIHRAYVPAVIVPPAEPLESLPRQLGNWTGKDVTLDKRLTRAIGAHSTISRTYQNSKGDQVSMHLAILTDAIDGVAHYPEVCYPSAGWKVIRRETKRLAGGNANTAGATARLMIIERGDQQATVLFWYELGDGCFVDRDSYRQARRAFFGRSQWPAAVKILLQSSDPDARNGERSLADFAEQVHVWTTRYKTMAALPSPTT